MEQHERVRIVIADDDANVRRDLRDLLEIAGATVIVGEAGDGLAAVDKTGLLRPDTVILDIEMPRLDGFAAARRIKTALPQTRVVALTVHGDAATRQRAADAGIDAFVVKGAPLSELLGAVRPLTSTNASARRLS